MRKVKCLTYKGSGNELKRLKELTKVLFSETQSYIRVSTCQRIEIFSDEKLPTIPGMHVHESEESMVHLVEVLSGIHSGLF